VYEVGRVKVLDAEIKEFGIGCLGETEAPLPLLLVETRRNDANVANHV
jgi:hypothetical protein